MIRDAPTDLATWQAAKPARTLAAVLTLDLPGARWRIGIRIWPSNSQHAGSLRSRSVLRANTGAPRRFSLVHHNHPAASLCFVDDGSSDGTMAVLEGLRSQCVERILVHRVAKNGGKAEAVRAGVRHVAAGGQWPIIGYWDADLSTPLDEVDRLLETFRENPDCQLVLGSRVKRLGAHIERRMSRHIMGRIFATCASAILGSVYDSQWG